MAKKFHINPETGKPGVCNAVHQCRFGGSAADHYDTAADARAAYEAQMNTATDGLKKIQAETAAKRAANLTEEDGIATAKGLAEAVGLDDYKARKAFMEEYRKENPDLGYTYGDDEEKLMAEMANAYPKKLNAILKAEALREGYIDKSGERIPARLVQDIEELQNSSGRTQYGFPEDEMIRHNIETKLKEMRKDLTHLEATKAGLVKTEPEKNTWGRESDPYALKDENGRTMGYIKEVYAGDLPNRTFVAQEADGEEIATVADLPMAMTFVERRDENRTTSAKAGYHNETGTARFRGTEVPLGKKEYDTAVIASIQYNKVTPGAVPLSVKEAGTKTIIVPNIKNLTAKRRIEIGAELWRQSGRSMDTWEKASDEEKVRFSHTHMGKLKNVKVESDGKMVSVSHDSGMRHGDNDDTSLLSI